MTGNGTTELVGSTLYTTATATPAISSAADISIGTFLIFCTLIGLPGNLLAFMYFWGKRNHSYPDLLYTIISAADSCTCAITFPMISSLFANNRDKSLFGNGSFCGIWVALFFFLLRFSQFMVVVISVTRAISMRAPFYQVKKLYLTVACVLYASFLLTLEALFSGTGVLSYRYIRQVASCVTVNNVEDWRYTTFVFLNLIIVVLVSTTVFCSFALTVTTLLKGTRTGNKDFRKVSVTISIFTAVFLMCNLPLFLAEMLQNVFTWIEYWPGLSNPFMSWYGFFVGYRLSTALNATANPILYFSFMPKFRIWIQNCFYKYKARDDSMKMTHKIENGQPTTKKSYNGECTKNSIFYDSQ